MDSVTVKKSCEKHKDLVDLYFKNDGKVLYSLIDKVLFKLKFDVEKSDFYSLGSEIFLDALCRYDETQDFNGFLYSCLINKSVKISFTIITPDRIKEDFVCQRVKFLFVHIKELQPCQHLVRHLL